MISIVSKNIMGCSGGQINMHLPPGHPIIAIRNNRNQNGRRIGKKVNWQLIRVMTLFHYQDEIARRSYWPLKLLAVDVLRFADHLPGPLHNFENWVKL